MTTRRDFLAATLAAASLAAMPAFAARRKPAQPAPRKPGDPMSILVLGGTGFLGPHFVEAARAKGHKLTLVQSRQDQSRRASPASNTTTSNNCRATARPT